MHHTTKSLKLLAQLIGEHQESPTIQLIAQSDHLVLGMEPGLGEGEPIESHLGARPYGYCLGCKDGVVNHVFLYLEPRDGYRVFKGSLIGGLSAESSRSAVRAAMGEPEKTGEPSSHSILGQFGAWDRFISGSFFIHFQYALDGNGIALITLMPRDDAP